MFAIVLATALIGQCNSCGSGGTVYSDYGSCGSCGSSMSGSSCNSGCNSGCNGDTATVKSLDCTICGCGDAQVNYWTTVKVTTSNCYLRVPVVNGCLPRIRYHRNEDGNIVSMTCDYSANIPYEGGCPTYAPVQKKTNGKMPPPKETKEISSAPAPPVPARMPAPKD